jgi:hypothetical protein
VTSHLPQVAASALADVALETTGRLGEAVYAVAGGGFRDTTRIAASDPHLWVGILGGNRDAVVAALDALTDRLLSLRDALAQGDDATVEALLARASTARRGLARADGVREPLDLAVALDDRPGALAVAVTALGEAGINVADLAMRHATAGDRGPCCCASTPRRTTGRSRRSRPSGSPPTSNPEGPREHDHRPGRGTAARARAPGRAARRGGRARRQVAQPPRAAPRRPSPTRPWPSPASPPRGTSRPPRRRSG